MDKVVKLDLIEKPFFICIGDVAIEMRVFGDMASSLFHW